MNVVADNFFISHHFLECVLYTFNIFLRSVCHTDTNSYNYITYKYM